MATLQSLILIGMLVSGPTTTSFQAPYTPKTGTAERKSIMDAARIPIEAKLKKAVVFKVNDLKVENGWAFMVAIPQTPEGRLAYDGTQYAEGWKAGFVSDEVCVLLHWQADRWRVATYAIGPTDVVYESWDKKYGAPHAIFR